jgi:CBS domain-containing protein
MVDLAADLPILIEWIDSVARVSELWEELLSFVTPGLVTVEDTTIALRAQQPFRDVPSELSVATVMTRDPICVTRDTTVREVVAQMREHGLRGIPVVDRAIPVGMITSSDLVTRANLGVSMSLVPGLDPSEVGDALGRLDGLLARDVMTAPAVVVRGGLPLTRVASMMVMQKLKRLPVVDERGALVGIVSRVDLLRTVTQWPECGPAETPRISSSSSVRVEKVMRREVPTVFSNASIAEVVQAVASTRLNRALVVDTERRVIGIVTAVELLERVTPGLRSTTLAALLQRLPFLHPSPAAAEAERHASARTAQDLMTTDFVTAQPDTPLKDAIQRMVQGSHKLVAVVNDRGELLGVVDRADVLRGMLTVP